MNRKNKTKTLIVCFVLLFLGVNGLQTVSAATYGPYWTPVYSDTWGVQTLKIKAQYYVHKTGSHALGYEWQLNIVEFHWYYEPGHVYDIDELWIDEYRQGSWYELWSEEDISTYGKTNQWNAIIIDVDSTPVHTIGPSGPTNNVKIHGYLHWYVWIFLCEVHPNGYVDYTP